MVGAIGDDGLSVGSVRGATEGEAMGDQVGLDEEALVDGGWFVGTRVGSPLGAAGSVVGLGVTGLVDAFHATGGLTGVDAAAPVVGGLISTTFCDPKFPLIFAKDLPSNRTSK